MKRAGLIAALLYAFAPVSAAADFVENNMLAIFYHELGHAIVDHMQVPIFGQEEDAADTLSVVLIDALFKEKAAAQIAYDSANLFWAEATDRPAFWDVHGPDEQRYYNTVCLFYGADPDLRQDFATELDLPAERAEGCFDEFALAADSWNAVLDEMEQDRELTGVLYVTGRDRRMDGIAEEIEALNNEFGWPVDVAVNIDECGEANAFYDPADGSITMCLELLEWLEEVESKL